jgi:hypothetical protein
VSRDYIESCLLEITVVGHVLHWGHEKISETMESYFEQLIKGCDPNAAGLPMWPVGTPDAAGNVHRLRI